MDINREDFLRALKMSLDLCREYSGYWKDLDYLLEKYGITHEEVDNVEYL
jgi:hypothetical protein